MGGWEREEDSPLFSCHRRNFLYKNYGYLHSINITLVVVGCLVIWRRRKRRLAGMRLKTYRTPRGAPISLRIFYHCSPTLTYLRCCDAFFLFRLIMVYYVYFCHFSTSPPSAPESQAPGNLYTFSLRFSSRFSSRLNKI